MESAKAAKQIKLTNFSMTKVEWSYNVLFSGHQNTLPASLLSVEQSVLYFPDVLLVP